jgi:uncharacterized protein (TIGR00661 family)
MARGGGAAESFLGPRRRVTVRLMKILYGVVGEGMGHAMRSRVVLDHLVGRGHEVEIMASGRACAYLGATFGEVNEIHGLHMIKEENRVRRGKTFWSNVLAGVTGVPQNIAAYFRLIEDFHPDAVISDFESWTYLYAKLHDLPIFSIDNMQIINRCELPAAIVEGQRLDFEVAKAFVKSKLPFCDHYLITSFFRPRVRKPRTSLYPPILREEILGATPSRGDHLLVYQTGEGFDALARSLARTGIECRIYGMRRDIHEEQVEGNLRHRPFDEATFIQDLASARAVIAAAGFTLMGEAVYLHKPMLAVPLSRQFEQTLNARYLEYEGFGRSAENTGEISAIQAFLDDVPRFEENLAGYSQDGNRALLGGLDELLFRAQAGEFD